MDFEFVYTHQINIYQLHRNNVYRITVEIGPDELRKSQFNTQLVVN